MEISLSDITAQRRQRREPRATFREGEGGWETIITAYGENMEGRSFSCRGCGAEDQLPPTSESLDVDDDNNTQCGPLSPLNFFLFFFLEEHAPPDLLAVTTPSFHRADTPRRPSTTSLAATFPHRVRGLDTLGPPQFPPKNKETMTIHALNFLITTIPLP